MTLRILYVDDEADIREIVTLSLSLDPDIQVETASSGATALDRAREGGWDLILLDVMMPVMDGPTAFAELGKNEATRAIPVGFVTARTQQHEIAHFLALGATGVIAKPFDPMTLAKQVRRLCAPRE
ncbi:response regulator [Aquabacter sp. L1I39]|uniref:response regulator n=1 Tax=Aquabacter sp. L1I39 TaxID=2820278 RepID=UPI001ADC8CBB|nr:response regulator [Aquabacter sp. L1I39]QTL03797.1 response regulator [Aquabacter sp. L1I39]